MQLSSNRPVRSDGVVRNLTQHFRSAFGTGWYWHVPFIVACQQYILVCSHWRSSPGWVERRRAENIGIQVPHVLVHTALCCYILDYVDPVANMVGRVPPIPLFLAGNSTPTIPHLFSKHKGSGFPVGSADTAAAMCMRSTCLGAASPAWVVSLWRRLPWRKALCARNKPSVQQRLVVVG